MENIKFNKTSNAFINTGIIGLYRYLGKFKRTFPEKYKFEFFLENKRLILKGGDLLSLIEEVYYMMGKDIYDTSSKKQLAKADKYFFCEEPFSTGRFPKMNSFGLAGFLTKAPFGPAPTPKIKPVKFLNLLGEKPEFANKIAAFYAEKNLRLKKIELIDGKPVINQKQNKGDSNIYLNEPYSKLPRLDFKESLFEKGTKTCPIINENFKILVSSKGTFPFISNVNSFNSFLETDDNVGISFKAKILSLFSPALAMYVYENGYDNLITLFFNSPSLKTLNEFYSDEIYYLKDEMESWDFSFQQNIRLHNFYEAKKESNKINLMNDYSTSEEVTFLLIYTFYRNKLKDNFDFEKDSSEIDILRELGIDKSIFSLVSFKADKFASTMRPKFYEEFTNTKYLIRLIHKLETNENGRIPIREVWRGLILKSDESEFIKDFNKRKKVERALRAQIINDLFRGSSILTSMVSLFHKSFLKLSKNENAGYRRYDLLLKFLEIYQATLNIQNMDKELQQRAINLGKSIGQAILNYESPKNESERKTNAKNGRKYLIGLHKSRTINQFRDNLIRIQNKYGVSVANDILENMNETNYIAIKQFAQMGALNTLNIVLSKID